MVGVCFLFDYFIIFSFTAIMDNFQFYIYNEKPSWIERRVRREELLKTDRFSNLQTFEDYGNVFVSDKIQKSVKNVIYRYMPIDNFLNFFYGQYIYLVSPSRWDDTYETKYIEWLKKTGNGYESLRKLRVFAICFSTTLNSEEASWKVYKSSGDNIVRIAIDYGCFLRQLRQISYSKLYLSAVNYQTRYEINEEKPMDGECSAEELFVHNFSLKQNAYEYEKEIRLCAFGGDEDHLLLNGFDWKKAIRTITFPPHNKGRYRGLYDMYHYYLTDKLGFDSNQILMSQLYDNEQEDVETVYHPQY